MLFKETVEFINVTDPKWENDLQDAYLAVKEVALDEVRDPTSFLRCFHI